jgi:hypothetical protein
LPAAAPFLPTTPAAGRDVRVCHPPLDGVESLVIDSTPEHSQPRQLILPTDRRNPCISLYRMTDSVGRRVIQVYYGLELLEEVADDFQDPTYRSMVARLYNAKLKLKSLVEVFQIDPKTILFFELKPGETRHNDHAGLLLFASALGHIAGSVTPPQPLLQQWLAGLLLGALNVEQTKFLNWTDLDFLLGTTTRSPALQRTSLKALATAENLVSLFQWNHRQIQQADSQPNNTGTSTGTGTDFYFDPHTQHYTGMQAVLKGWCAAIRRADKLINSDYARKAPASSASRKSANNSAPSRLPALQFPPILRFSPTHPRPLQSLPQPP